MRYYFPIIVLATTALVACGGNAPVKKTAVAPQNEAVSAPVTPALPPRKNSDGLMYDLMVGELALQRGQIDVALQQYAKAARDSNDLAVIERAARIADFAFNPAAGVEMARLWVELDPKNLEARQILANSLMRAGKADAAVHEIEFIILVLSNDRQSYFRIASQLAREKDQEAALEVMDRLARRHNEDPFAQLAYAQLATRYNRAPLALEKVDLALKLKPDWPDALVLRAHVLQMQNRAEDALNIYSSALSGALADNAGVRMAYARLLLDLKRYDDAYAQYSKLAAQDVENGDVIYATALLAMQTNHYEHAEKLLLQLLKINERVLESSYYLGQIAEKNKFLDEALDWYDQVSSGEFYLNARMRTAAIMAKQGLAEEALAQLHTVKTTTAQEQIQLYTMEGDIHLEIGEHQKAFDIYDRALKELPDSSNLRYARAIAAEKLNRIDIAERDLRDILNAEPNNVQALNALGYTLADRTSRYGEALDFIQRALSLDPKDAAIIDSMGWVQYRLGNHGEAITYLRRALELTQDSEVAAHLGEALWAAGKKDEAVAVWNQALKSTPDSKALISVMKRFGL